MPAPIATLWIGGDLSVLDQICLKSFVAQGHPVTLFHYFPITNAPSEITLADARDVYEDDNILIHKSGSPAMHADIFRLHLSQKTPMIWADADMFCLQPFVPDQDYLIARQTEKDVINCVFRMPANSQALAFMLDFVQDRHPIPPWLFGRRRHDHLQAQAAGTPIHVSQMLFTTYGPRLLKHALHKFDEIQHVSPVETFLPLPSRKHRFAAKANHYDTIVNGLCKPHTQGIHLWNTLMKRKGWLDRIEQGSFLDRKAQELDVQISTIPADTPTSNQLTHSQT